MNKMTNWLNKDITLPLWGWLVIAVSVAAIHDLIKWSLS